MSVKQNSKVCIYCKRNRSASHFYIRADRPHLLNAYCRDCGVVKSRERYRQNGKKPQSGPHPWKGTIKELARGRVSSAIRDGRIQRQSCGVCGAKAQAHHEDYSKPLEVAWFCTKHHGEQHWKSVDTPIAAAIRKVKP